MQNLLLEEFTLRWLESSQRANFLVVCFRNMRIMWIFHLITCSRYSSRTPEWFPEPHFEKAPVLISLILQSARLQYKLSEPCALSSVSTLLSFHNIFIWSNCPESSPPVGSCYSGSLGESNRFGLLVPWCWGWSCWQWGLGQSPQSPGHSQYCEMSSSSSLGLLHSIYINNV